MKLLCLQMPIIRLKTEGILPESFSSAGRDSVNRRVIIRQRIVSTPGKASVDCQFTASIKYAPRTGDATGPITPSTTESVSTVFLTFSSKQSLISAMEITIIPPLAAP